jgi:hypothetical protein
MSPQPSHNVISDASTRLSGGEAVAFSQLRSSLIKVLRNSPESREPICDALELIEALQQQVEAKRHPDPPAAAEPARAARRAQASQGYIVQRTAEGDFLTERRPSGSQPFRCPKDAYDAAAKLLADAQQPLHFEELLDQLNGAMRERQADYRLRVCLRFWLASGRVERFRTRYRATEPAAFEREAQGLWEKARGA